MNKYNKYHESLDIYCCDIPPKHKPKPVHKIDDYDDLENKPRINNVTLTGNKTTEELGIEIPDVSQFITKNVNDLRFYTRTRELSRVATTGNYNDLVNKPDTVEIPENISYFNNDVGYLTEHQDLTDYITKSETTGLVKNDGTIDTNTYLTEHQSLTGYVKNTDYAGLNIAGVVKANIAYGTNVTSGGIIYPIGLTYEQYQSAGGECAIGKSTLENVITGKRLVSDTDYATNVGGNKAGIIKVGTYGTATVTTSSVLAGQLYCASLNYSDYTNQNVNYFISKGTLENVITGKQLVDKTYVDNAINELKNYIDNLLGG